MIKQTAVSIIINLSKGSKRLDKTINSIKAQANQNWQIIIIKNKSDEIKENNLNFNDREKVFFVDAKESHKESVQAAVQMANGEFLSFVCPGDQWHHQKLEKQINFLNSNPRTKMCGTFVRHISYEPKSQEHISSPHNYCNKILELNKDENWIWQSPVCLSSVLIQKSAFEHELMYEWLNGDALLIGLYCNGVKCGLLSETLTFVNDDESFGRDLIRNTVSGLWEYANLSKNSLHPYLVKSGRSDLVVRNIRGFINHPCFSVLKTDEIHLLAKKICYMDEIKINGIDFEFAESVLDECSSLLKSANKLNAVCLELQKENNRFREEINRFPNRLIRKIMNRNVGFFSLIHKNRKKYKSAIKAIKRFSFRNVWSDLFLNYNSKQPEMNASPWVSGAPLVSVIIPCFNYGKFISEAIDSVQRQSFQDFEIIVVDDGSNDPKTTEVLKTLNATRTKIVYQKNQGVSAARNNGIGLAQGKYICCLDADDLLDEMYLEKCVYFLETRNIDICYSWVRIFGGEEKVWECGPFLIDDLLKGNEVSTAAVFTKESWKKAGGYSTQMANGYEDWEFWIRLSGLGVRGHVIPEPLFLYRKHGISLTTSTDFVHDKLTQQIKSYHSDLFKISRDFQRARYQQSQKPIHISGGLENLSRTLFRYSDPEKINILVAVPWFDIGGSSVLLKNIFSEFPKDRFGFFTVATNDAKDELGLSLYRCFSDDCYNLPKFLTPVDYFSFLEHIILSRKISVLFLVGSPFVYDQLPKLRAKFPNLTVIDHLYNKVGHVVNNRKFTDFIDFNIVANEEVRDFLIEKGENTNRIEVIPHGIDAYRFNPGIESFAVARNSKFKAKFTFGFLGRLSHEKRPQDFIALARLLPECDFRICGDGPLKSKLMKDVAGHNDQNVTFENHFNDPLEFYASIDALVVTSEVEGLPLVLLEAMSLELPVIATKVGRIPLVIRHGENGFIYDTMQLDVLLEIASRLCKQSSESLKLIGQNARRTVLDEYRIEKCANKYMNRIQNLSGKILD